MSKSTYARRAAAVLASAVLLVGCGSGAPPRSPRSSTQQTEATARWPCLAPLHASEVTAPGGLHVALVDTGPRVAVLSNESDEDACGWARFVPQLTAAGFAVALYDYDADPAGDAATVTRFVRSRGAALVTLVGASEGAKVSIAAAASVHPAAVVSLSAEAELRGEPVAPYAQRLDEPTLFVTASDDPYGATPATRGFYRSAPAKVKQLVTVPGAAHGIALLASSALAGRVLDFLVAQTAGTTPQPCGPGATAFWLPGPDHTLLEANSYGAGPAAAVFLHEAGRLADMCGFWPYARWLADHDHVRVVLFNRCTYGRSTCQVFQQGDDGIAQQVQPAVDWAREHGATRVTLVGASSGASDALQAGGVVAHVAAVVALSSDVTDTGADEHADARRLRVPTLLAVAPHDGTSPVAAVRATYSLVPAAHKQLIVVADAGDAHGWDLLQAPAGGFPPLARTVADWVAGRLP